MANATRHNDRPAARPGRSTRRGLTLLEVIIALALTIMMMAGVFAFFQSALFIREEGRFYAAEVTNARATLMQIADEIRHATDIVPGDGIGFRGRKDSITIVRLRLPENYAFNQYDPMFDDLPPAQMDLVRVKYELAWNDQELTDDDGTLMCHGLARFEQKTFDPNPRYISAEDESPTGGEEVEGDEGESDDEMILDEEIERPHPEGGLWAPEIKYLRLRYFDGAEWRDRWQTVEEGVGIDTGKAAVNGQVAYMLPQAIEITIGSEKGIPPPDKAINLEFSEEEEEEDPEEYHPDRYTMIVYLPQADKSRTGSMSYGRQANPPESEYDYDEEGYEDEGGGGF